MGLKLQHMALIGVIAAVLLGVIVTVISVSTGGSSQPSAAGSTSSGPFKAVVVLNVGSVAINGSSGVLVLEQENDKAPVTIKGSITNLLPAGNHGFHVHESGNVTGGCGATGGHYNPYGKNHGAPSDDERHIGDLGNVVADAVGNAIIDLSDSLISLTGEYSIIGRAIVVHEGSDDLGKGGDDGSKKTGNAGGRRFCGVIGTIYNKA